MDAMTQAAIEYRAARNRRGGTQPPQPDNTMPPDDGVPPRGGPFIEHEPARSSRFFPASDLYSKPVPARKWLVRDLVPSGTVTLLGGDGGTGKSLLALMLAHSVATGTRWLNHGVTAGRAIYLSAEDDEDELHRRLNDIVQGGSFAGLGSLTLRSLAGEDALLASLDRSSGVLSPTGLHAEIEAQMGLLKPELLVLDTLADLFPGNENDRAQARQFIGMLRGFAIRHDCAVVLLAHPSLSGLNSGSGTSGSTGWSNSVRSRLYLERVAQEGYEPDPNARVLSSKKSNYGPVGIEIAMTWRNGVFVADEQPDSLDRMATGMKAERVFLKLLRTFTEQGRRVNASGGTRFAPAVFASHPDAEGCTRSALRAAMESLMVSGRIRNVEDGPPSRRSSFIVLGAEQ